eukprot:348419-Amorphochlora_amoeboformis.AAC.3
MCWIVTSVFDTAAKGVDLDLEYEGDNGSTIFCVSAIWREFVRVPRLDRRGVRLDGRQAKAVFL